MDVVEVGIHDLGVLSLVGSAYRVYIKMLRCIITYMLYLRHGTHTFTRTSTHNVENSNLVMFHVVMLVLSLKGTFSNKRGLFR